ncbi:MAG: sulfatase [Phycisphaeraceae bacterium]|nr:sulfatase [Phycisphaeraceae bacterium]
MTTPARFVLVAVLVLTFGGLSPQTSAGEAKRPNIIFAFADDWGRYASAYREADRPTINDVFETPHFDQLARQGVLFWDAHVSSPSCSPSRTAVLTGRHFFRNGSGAQLHNPWSGDPEADPVKKLESYHTLLEDAGYHTGVTYKTHVSMHLFVDKAHVYNKAGGRVNAFSQFVSQAENDKDIAGRKQQLLGMVRGNMRDFLAAREDGQPFCWYFSPTNPHRTWTQGSGKKLWGIDPDDLKGKMPAFVPDVHTIREDMADYLGECKAFDEQIGVVVDELKKQGLYENTILVISGDHGAPGFPRGKTSLINFGSQVPLLIHWPDGVAKPGRRIDNPTSTVDLAPTFLEIAGLPVHEQMDGNSLLPILKDGEATGISELGNQFVITGRERHKVEARAGHLPYPSRAIRTKGFLYIRNFKPDRWPQFDPPMKNGLRTQGDFDGGRTKAWYAENQDNPQYKAAMDLAWGLRPAEELYDLNKDVDQMTNLADDPEYAEVKAELAGKLMDVLVAGEDPRIVGEGDAFDKPPYWKKNR